MNEVSILYTRNIKLKDTGELVFDKGIKYFVSQVLKSGKYTPDELYFMPFRKFLKLCATEFKGYGYKPNDDLKEYDMAAAVKHIRRYIKNWVEINPENIRANTDGFEFIIHYKLTPDDKLKLWLKPNLHGMWTQAQVRTLMYASDTATLVRLLNILDEHNIPKVAKIINDLFGHNYWRFQAESEVFLAYFNKLVKLFEKKYDSYYIRRVLSVIKNMDPYEYALISGCLNKHQCIYKQGFNYRVDALDMRNRAAHIKNKEGFEKIMHNQNPAERGFGFNKCCGNRIKLFQEL